LAATARRGWGAVTWTLWGLMAFLSVGVGGYALFHAFTGFQHVPGSVMDNTFPSIFGIGAHIAASGVALLVGAFQFLPQLRRAQPALHRWTGRIYVAACLIGGLAGGAIALFSASGPVAGWGFFMLALLWIPFTLLAWTAAMRRDFIAHERWMIRSFALTFAAVTLRLQLPIGITLTQGDFTAAYVVIAWSAWVPNLLVAELWLMTKRQPRLRPSAA
jgi:hypothetical protein